MSDRDKQFGPQGNFPQTRISAITALKGEDAQERKLALERIIESYWSPVYKYLRLRWRKDADSAADLTQGFFLVALEKAFLADYDPAKARFRTFCRRMTCLNASGRAESVRCSRGNHPR